jgi:hypothetical protein
LRSGGVPKPPIFDPPLPKAWEDRGSIKGIELFLKQKKGGEEEGRRSILRLFGVILVSFLAVFRPFLDAFCVFLGLSI